MWLSKELEKVARKAASTTQEHVLRELARHEEPGIRRRVANNRFTPIDVLWSFVQDPSRDVRYELLRNKACTPEIEDALTKDPDEWVRIFAVRIASLEAVGLRYETETDPRVLKAIEKRFSEGLLAILGEV